MPDAVTIGRSTDTGHDLALGDIERRSGLYVLGKPGMGKTTLLVNLILKDIAHGHGVFFLDPHGDAVDDILKRSDSPRLLTDVVELDPQHPTHTFSINLLACNDIASWRAREDTYARARAVFWKLFETDDQATWLPLVLQNTLYAFIESPGYSLADVPEFLDNPDFRNHILSQVKYNTPASDFFRKGFHPRQAQPLRDRLALLLGHPPVRHIVGQPTTTVDFAQMMQERKILLIKLSANLAPDQKRFIGMLLVSELLQAVRARGALPAEERHQFCIFVDEFQNFVSSEDFAALINEGRKFGVATTIAHQERYGQLAGNRALLGATAAAANKVYFQLAGDDAREVALDFARPPPTETRLEPQLVISQNPISDLLRGHANPQIRSFVTRYLRPLQERLEDIKEDMEQQRLFRDDVRDLAAIDRVEAQMESLQRGMPGYLDTQHAALANVISSLLFARAQTAQLLSLHKSSRELRSVIRGFNRFLSATMEGSITQGQEQFSQFLIRILRVHEFSLVPEKYAPVLELYISLKYGDSRAPRTIPFTLAREQQVFTKEVALLTHQAQKEFECEKEAVLQTNWERRYARYLNDEALEQANMNQYLQPALLTRISNIRFRPSPLFPTPQKFGKTFLEYFLLLYEYPSLAKLFAPYYTARFAAPWSDQLPDIATRIPWMLDWIASQRKRAQQGLEYVKYYNPASGRLQRLFRPHPARDSYPKGDLYDIDLLDWTAQFLEAHGEGALVVLILLETLWSPYEWLHDWLRQTSFFGKPPHPYGEYYKAFNMLYLPPLMNKEPLAIFLFLNRAAHALPRLDAGLEYVWRCPQYHRPENPEAPPEQFFAWYKYCEEIWEETVINKLEQHSDTKLLGQLLTKSHSQLLRERWWTTQEQLVRLYLMSRACYLVRFCRGVADKAFPQPTIQGVSSDTVSSIVTSMADMLREEVLQQLDQERQSALAKLQSEARGDLCQTMRNKSPRLPAHLACRELSENESEALKRACVAELLSRPDWDGQATLAVIEEFAHFCTLLNKPENHIKIYTGQYVEKQVNTRTYADMSNEMSQVLVGLERYSAYAKVLHEDKREQKVLTQKIKTLPMPPVRGGEAAERYLQRVRRDVWEETLRAGWVKERGKIEEEMRHRQRDWPSMALEEPPRQSTGELEFAFPSEALLFDPDEPPPPSSSTQTREAVPNNATHEKPDKGQLVYRSDFMYFSKDWGVEPGENVRCFRQDGYFHMAASNSDWASNTAWRPIADFKVFVDAQFMRYEVNNASYGFVFRARAAPKNIYSRYVFLVSGLGYYGLWAVGEDVEPSTIVDWCFSEWIKRDSHATNSLMVEMVGQRITLGVNDHILTSVTDAKRAMGKVGVLVYPGSGTFVEARFRDFRLYAL
jgi:hypothetical protein